MSPPALELDRLRKTFRLRRSLIQTLRHPGSGTRLTALDQISCQVPEGEYFGILGENGAGKTTLFRILSTLVVPDSGRAAIFGVDVAQEPARIRRLVATVLANERSLSWRLSAVENLRLYAALHRLPAGETNRRITELLEIVGLAEVGPRMAGTFSSGMKQRLLLARALLPRPRMLLLDEPTRSLDPLAARAFREFLRRDLRRSQGCTVLLATHDPEEVRDLCDRVGVLHKGSLVAMGTTNALAAQLGYHRFRLITRAPNHPAIEQLVHNGARLGPAEPEYEEGWHRRDLDLPASDGVTADLVSRLVQAGVPVARFERIELPLADLIERLSSRAAGATHA